MSPAKKALLYWNTVRYLKPIQIYYRLWRRIYLPYLDCAISVPRPRKKTGIWQTPICHPQSMFGQSTFRFLHVEHTLPATNGWNDANLNKLYLYNLHYFDDLNATNSASRLAWHQSLVARWIQENPPPQHNDGGNAWEAYPTSLRIVNWVKWVLAQAAQDSSFKQAQSQESTLQASLYLQARWLSQRIEWHLLGNHLLANAKALLFAGVYFAGEEAERWLTSGIQIFTKQLPEQILLDGAHFERSPMYQAIILGDLLDVINLAQAYPDQLNTQFITLLKACVVKMMAWLEGMTHPDGQVSFFNDAAFSIGAELSLISAYAKQLGNMGQVESSQIEQFSADGVQLTYWQDSGYLRLESASATALLDAAPIGPDYLPGHAHADTLSFELSVFGQRVIVNGGTSTYEAGLQRQVERSTARHNTVEIDGESSSEVWGQFRVAQRARPRQLKVGSARAQGDPSLTGVVVSCEHDGYLRLAQRLMHRREWQMSSDQLVVTDLVVSSKSAQSTKSTKAIARYRLHPQMEPIQLSPFVWQLNWPHGSQQSLMMEVKHGDPQMRLSQYCPEFGKILSTHCLELTLVAHAQSQSLVAQVVFSWK